MTIYNLPIETLSYIMLGFGTVILVTTTAYTKVKSYNRSH